MFETQIILRIIGLAVLFNPSSNCLQFHINDLCFDPSPNNHVSSSPKNLSSWNPSESHLGEQQKKTKTLSFSSSKFQFNIDLQFWNLQWSFVMCIRGTDPWQYLGHLILGERVEPFVHSHTRTDQHFKNSRKKPFGRHQTTTTTTIGKECWQNWLHWDLFEKKH